MTRIGSIELTVILALLIVSFPSGTVPAQSQPADDGPLESVPADPLDQALFSPGEAGPANRSPGAQPGGSTEDGDLGSDLINQLGAAAVPEESTRLFEIARQMRAVENLIGKADSGTETRQLQGEIVTSLDDLIRQARQRSRQASPSQANPQASVRQQVQQPPPKPEPSSDNHQQNSDEENGEEPEEPDKPETRRPDMDQMKQLIKSVWGNLPEKERERMLEWVGEEFLPKYELLIEKYFQRLTERE